MSFQIQYVKGIGTAACMIVHREHATSFPEALDRARDKVNQADLRARFEADGFQIMPLGAVQTADAVALEAFRN